MDTLNLQLHIEWSLWKWTWRLDEKKVKVSVTQFCPTVWQYMDCSSPGSSVHGILQARILEWVATSYSRGSSPNRRDRTQVLCFTGRFSTTWATAFTSNKNNLQMKSRRTLILGAVEETESYQRETHTSHGDSQLGGITKILFYSFPLCFILLMTCFTFLSFIHTLTNHCYFS